MLGLVLLTSVFCFFNRFTSIFFLSLSLPSVFISYVVLSSHCLCSPIYSFFISDSTGLFMSYLSCIVVFMCIFYSVSLVGYHYSSSVTLYCMFLVCFLFFTVDSALILYVCYEISLLPIVYIILKWGFYPDRSYSALMLLFYTSFFTLPLISALFLVFSSFSSFSFFCCSFSERIDGLFVCYLVFMAFSVKLPVYGLHFWLPMAHVEAPTFGSIILAGVLLKLGGVGLIRFASLFEFSGLSHLVPILFFFMVFVTLICCFQSDFNRLVAYSSVSHMIVIPILVLSGSSLANSSIILVMLFHGLSSPIMFMLVGSSYSAFGTRQLALMNGLVLFSPIMALLSVLAFFFTLSAPPFPSFVAEVFSFLSIVHSSGMSYLFILIFAFLSLLYNLNWLSSLLFYSSKGSNYSFLLPFSHFLPIVVSLLMCVEFSLLLNLL